MENCEQIIELISAQLDGALTPEEEQQLQTHLKTCPNCRALAAELAALHRAMGQMNHTPPADLSDQIMARIRKEESAAPVLRLPRHSKKSRSNHWKAWGGLAAGLVATVALIAVGPGFHHNANGSAFPAAINYTDAAGNQDTARSADDGDTPAAGPSAVEAPFDIEFTDEYQAALWEEIGELEDHPDDYAPTVVDTPVLSDLTELEALSIVAEKVYGTDDYSFEFDEEKLIGYATMKDNGTVVDEGAIVFDGLSPNELYYMFHWTWPYQADEDAQLYQYSVSRVDSHIIWRGDVLDNGESYFSALK